MKILSIGNSFSEDAQRYVHQIAKKDGVDIFTQNLYIGGCSLETHYNNVFENNAYYVNQINGETTGDTISIKDALLSEDWDYITLQQVSGKSGDYSTYNPYIKNIYDYVKKLCPKAKILIHQTWAYEDKSELLESVGYKSADDMHSDIVSSYNKAVIDLSLDGLIPSGEAMMTAIKLGIGKIHRDTFHAKFGAGRYLIGLTWYKYFTNRDITNNGFDLFDEPVSDFERKIIIKAVNTVVKKPF